jgi:hypothetical protein
MQYKNHAKHIFKRTKNAPSQNPAVSKSRAIKIKLEYRKHDIQDHEHVQEHRRNHANTFSNGLKTRQAKIPLFSQSS